MKTAIVLALVTTLAAGAALARSATRQEPAVPPPPFESFRMDELRERRAELGRSYLSFLERSTLSCGLYRIGAGERDGQSPHAQDEVYHVLAGKGRFTAGEETVDVASGDVLFVAARAAHRFHDVAEDLEVLVFFSAADPGGEGDGDGPAIR